MKILIADSGSTKTDWCVVEAGEILFRIKTSGMNPFFQTEAEMEHELRKSLLPFLSPKSVEKVYFYGAGCIPEKIPFVCDLLEKTLEISVEVEGDLLGAARALCGREPGIACILGTGSNSCFYDGNRIVENVPPLGYVLGDEAGGAHLGRSLVREYLRGNLSAECENAFFEKYGLQKKDILDSVYKQPFPNRFLASFASFLPPFIKEEKNQRLRETIKNCFRDFFRNCISQYDCKHHQVNAIGSIAWYFQSEINEVAAEEGINMGIFCQSPIDGLMKYHFDK